MTAPAPNRSPDPEALAAIHRYLASASGSPDRRLLGAATLASRFSVSPAMLRRVVLSSSQVDPDLRSLVEDSSRFKTLFAKAARRQRAGRRDSSPAAVRRTTARLLVGTLLGSPTKCNQSLQTHSASMDGRARVLTALVGVRILRDERGWGTLLAGTAELGVDLGWSRAGARSVLSVALDQRYLIERQRRPGGARVLALHPLTTKAQRDACELYLPLIQAVAGAPYDDPTGHVTRARDVVLGVTDPAFHYDAVPGITGGRLWLAAVCLMTSAPPDKVGLSPRQMGAARRQLEEAGLGRESAVSVGEALNRMAGETGAAERAVAAHTRRRQEVADRKVALEKHRQLVTEAKAVVDGLPKTPRRSARQAEADAWMRDVRRALANFPSSHRREVGRQLERRLRQAGLPPAEAERGAAQLMPQPPRTAAA